MVVVNTNRKSVPSKPGEPAGRHRDVSLVANNGTRTAADLRASMEGCNNQIRFDERRDDFNVLQAIFSSEVVCKDTHVSRLKASLSECLACICRVYLKQAQVLTRVRSILVFPV